MDQNSGRTFTVLHLNCSLQNLYTPRTINLSNKNIFKLLTYMPYMGRSMTLSTWHLKNEFWFLKCVVWLNLKLNSQTFEKYTKKTKILIIKAGFDLVKIQIWKFSLIFFFKILFNRLEHLSDHKNNNRFFCQQNWNCLYFNKKL
jgi:hypothetical protein